MHIFNKTSSPSSTRLLLLIGVLSCTLSGCGNSIQSKVVGEWKIKQVDRVANRLDSEQEGVDIPETNEQPRMKIQFLGDGTMRTETKMGAIDVKKNGTWKLLSEDLQGCEIECLLADQTTKHDIEFVNATTIKLAPPNMAGVNMKLEFEKAD